MKSLSIFRAELRTNLVWHLAWLITLSAFVLLLIGIYPGDTAMQGFTSLFETTQFQEFFGKINPSVAGYYLWISFMIPFLTILLLIYATTTGVRTAIQSISDGTGELFYTLPVTRVNYLFTRIISNFIPLALFYFIEAAIFRIPIDGHVVQASYLYNIAWWGILFSFFGLMVGVLLALLAGNASKGHQLSIILVLILYAVQILSRVPKTGLQDTNSINFLSFYQPDQYLMGNQFVKYFDVSNYVIRYFPFILAVLSILFLIIAILEFRRKDLSNDAGFHFNFIKRISLNLQNEYSESNLGHYAILMYFLIPFKIIFYIFRFIKNILFPKSVRNNPFVFWARIFEEKMPITADFIYSDSMLIFIGFFAIFLFYPLQMLAYPGDTAMLTSVGSGSFSNSVFLIFTYGHNLLTNLGSQPHFIFFWYMIANTIGITWMILLPITFFWVRKAIVSDGNSGTGEILGGIPLDSKNVVFQRLVAIFSELVFLLVIMIVWLIISEALLQESYNQVWEILSILSMIPFYMFLVTFCCLLALLFKRRGALLSGLFLIGILISFIISVVNTNLNTWYFRGIFDLYDPVLIIQKQSLLTNNYGLVILVILAILSTIGLYLTSKNYTWLNITNKSKSPAS